MKVEISKQKSRWILISGLIIIGFLALNYFLGTQKIEFAHDEQFRGGICGASTTEICQETTGFDFYILLQTFFLVPFIFGFLNVLKNLSLIESLAGTTAITVLTLIITEITIRILDIPVLITSFHEGRQSLSYSFLPSNFSLFMMFAGILFLSLIASMIGNITGYIVNLLIKNTSRSHY